MFEKMDQLQFMAKAHQYLGDGVLIVDAEGRVVFMNDAGWRIMQGEKSLSPGKVVEDLPLRHPDGRSVPTNETPLGRALRGETVVDLQLVLDKRDGRKASISIMASPVVNEQGKIVGAISIFRDPTQQKRTEDELRESERRFRLLAENAQDVIFRVRLKPEPAIEYISPAALVVTGYKPEEYYANFGLAIKLIYSRESELQPGVPQLDKLAPPPGLLELKHKDGRQIWLEVRYTEIFDATGVVEAVEGIARDITDRKQAERERDLLLQEMHELNEQLVTAAVRESRQAEASEAARNEAEKQAEQLRLLLANLGEGVIILDGEGRVLLSNQAGGETADLIGDEQSVCLGQRLTLLGIDGIPLRLEERPVMRVLRGEEFRDCELILVREDGTHRHVVYSGNALFDDTGRVIMAILVYRDVTELRRLEKTREEYIHMISHDLKQPLTTIMGMSGWMSRQLAKEGDEQGARNAAMIVASAKSMTAMIGELVEFTRLENKQMEIEKEMVDLLVLVSEISQRVGTLGERQRLRVESIEWIPPTAVDRNHFERVLVNLISNAFKYSSPGTPVVVRLSRTRDEVLVSVSDQGKGIASDNLPHLFDRFYRVKEDQRKAEGLGLGLYISRLIVEAFGGRIWAESEMDKGSTFSFALPLV